MCIFMQLLTKLNFVQGSLLGALRNYNSENTDSNSFKLVF